MPGRNQTGPMGMGPMTGRRAGICAGNTGQEFTNAPSGRGFGKSFGGRRGLVGGRGWPRRGLGRAGWSRFGGYETAYAVPDPYRHPDPDVEKQALASQARSLQAELDLIQKRLAAIESEPATD
jgi:hypothetical protein